MMVGIVGECYRGERRSESVKYGQFLTPWIRVDPPDVQGKEEQVDDDASDNPPDTAGEDPGRLANIREDKRKYSPAV